MSAGPVEAVIAVVEHAMFGAEEGGLVSDDASLPVGELRRLLGEVAGPRIAALIADAEKRGAVKALRYEAERGRGAASTFLDSDPVAEKRGADLLRRAANAIDARADQIESGEVTLP